MTKKRMALLAALASSAVLAGCNTVGPEEQVLILSARATAHDAETRYANDSAVPQPLKDHLKADAEKWDSLYEGLWGKDGEN